MRNKVLIFIANGLGMAIDSEKYSLSSGIKNGFDSLDDSEEERLLDFMNLYRVDDNHISKDNFLQKVSEDNNSLAHINLISMLTRMIKTGEGRLKERFVSKEFEILVDTVNKFIFNVADSYNIEKTLDENDYHYKFNGFMQSLGGFVYEKKAYLATTNYDDLIYRYFLDEHIKTKELKIKIMKPRDGSFTLTDGFKTSKFSFDKEEYSYMHLHGSSRFYSTFGSEILLKKYLKSYDKKYVPHIILNNFDLKEFEISLNPVLNRYFKSFQKILCEIETLYIIGYGGKDKHINKAIKEGSQKEIIIVERGDTDVISDIPPPQWPDDLVPAHCNNVTTEYKKNILDYRF